MNHKTSSVNKSEDPRDPSPSLKAIALAAIFAVLFSIQTNAYPLHSGKYAFWPEMPEAAQVLTDMKGKNDLDTAARQYAALVLLIVLVTVSADGSGQNPWPPRERELSYAYSHALPHVRGHSNEMMAESLQLRADDSFVQPLLNRYFSEAAQREIKPMISDFEARAQRGVNEANAERKSEAARVGMTASQLETYNTYARIYLAFFLLFSVLWVVRILRAFKPIRTTADDPPQFEGPWKNLKIHWFSGYVRGAATRSDTTVVHSVRVVGNQVQGGTTSTTNVINTFRLVNRRNQREQNFELRNWDIQLWDDQLVSVAWAIRKGRTNGPYFIVVNHTTGQYFLENSVVRKIVKRPSLFWSLSFVICIVIPPVWLLGIFWEILISVQSKRFIRSGVQPLVKALNQNAAV